LLNTNLEEITPTIYDQIEVMELEDFGFANVVRDKKFGLLNAQGNNFLPTDYDEFINVEGFDYTGLVMIKKH